MITILILGYLISVAAIWLHLHKAHSKGGIYHGVNIDLTDVAVTVIPVVNTLMAVIGWTVYHPQRKEISLNKLFLIKN